RSKRDWSSDVCSSDLFLITTYLLYFNYKNQFHYRIISINPNNPIFVLLSTLGGRFPRARVQPRANKPFSVGQVSAVPVPGRRVFSLPPPLPAGSSDAQSVVFSVFPTGVNHLPFQSLLFECKIKFSLLATIFRIYLSNKYL